MLGTIAFKFLMMLKDLSSCLEEKNILSNNSINSSNLVSIGQLNGFLIPTTGQVTNITFSLYGSLALLTDLTLHKNIAE